MTTVGGQGLPRALANWLTTVEEQLLERPSFLGAKERVAARLLVARVPEAIVPERRSNARKNAQNKGSTPAHAPLTLLAWNLCITKGPSTRWPTATVRKVSPLRWHIALLVQSWQSARHVAALTTTQEDTPVWYLAGRLWLLVLHSARGPQIRAPLWTQSKRARSLLQRVRHVPAFAARGMQAIFQSALAWRRFRLQVCAPAPRLAAKAASKRRTTAPSLHEH